MALAWQLPVSSHFLSPGTGRRLHFFEAGERTDLLVRAACGRMFNPGFAEGSRGVRRCGACERKLRSLKPAP